MMSPRSFLVSRQHQRLRSSPTSSPTSVSDSPAVSRPTPNTETLPAPLPLPSPSPSPSPLPAPLPAPSPSPSQSPAPPPPVRPWRKNEQPTSEPPPPAVVTTTASACPALAAVSRRDQPARDSSRNAMIADRFQNGVQASPALFVDRRPSTPTSPVQIPFKAALGHETAHHHHHKPHHRYRDHDRDHDRRRPCRQPPSSPHSDVSRRRRHVQSPDSIPPSVAALLAVTSIPPPRGLRVLRQGRLDRLDEKRMTVDAIIDRAQGVEQQLSLSLSKSPLDVLLTPPDELEDDDGVSVSDSGLESVLSTRTVSLESMPSLSDSVATGTVSSLDSPCSPYRGAGCRARPKHRSLTPVSSPPGKREPHPLALDTASDSDADDDDEKLEFYVFRPLPDPLAKTVETRSPLQPFRSAFKSNLTASLRALRNAARSFSNLNLTSVPPEDFLTRSILTLDPYIPYTDERRPPPLEEEPSPALRRYLNPTSSARIDPRQSATPPALSPAPALASGPVALLASALGPNENSLADRPAFTASIQMHTYKVHRSRSPSAASASAATAASNSTSSSTSPSRSSTTAGPPGSPTRSLPATDDRPFPGPRQRELRENPDFIRVAVMEMAMRRMGKLDDRRPGRARLALPPRKASTRPYVIGADGVPARWVGTAVDGLS